jgi:hypothetical protein
MSLQTSLLYLVTWSLVAISPGPAVMCAELAVLGDTEHECVQLSRSLPAVVRDEH